MRAQRGPLVAAVIPCYRTTEHIAEVIANIGDEVDGIIVVDDACPDLTGQFVLDHVNDQRVRVIIRKKNGGVGAAVKTGYEAALAAGFDVIVKIDGDGQMDTTRLPALLAPVLSGEADYAKGNRFIDIDSIRAMPTTRLFGNAVLSFLSKLSTGYWDIFDPTNGFTAVDRIALERVPFDKVSDRYFFETDMLFRLNTARAVVVDVPMTAKYGEEVSGLVIHRIVFEFIGKHLRNLLKRIAYSYYLRDVSLASLELPLGLTMLCFGVLYGTVNWFVAARTGVPAATGVVMLAAMPVLLGLQLILAFFAYDIASVPRRPLSTATLSGEALRARRKEHEECEADHDED